jgi:DNA-binding transcriptional MerR regulator
MAGLNMATKTATTKKKTADNNAVVIPDKLYFRIGEVGDLCGLPAYVLRFWESEFPQLKPVKSGKGQRMYRQRDVENVLRIKKLLYEEGFTIAGARQHLKEEAKGSPLPFPKTAPTDELQKVRHGLQEILAMLDGKPTRARPAPKKA